jgi:hypothetical protein
LKTKLARNTILPIGWIAVGDPPKILPPEKHDEIWSVQRPLNFPGFVYGVKSFRYRGEDAGYDGDHPSAL